MIMGMSLLELPPTLSADFVRRSCRRQRRREAAKEEISGIKISESRVPGNSGPPKPSVYWQRMVEQDKVSVDKSESSGHQSRQKSLFGLNQDG